MPRPVKDTVGDPPVVMASEDARKVFVAGLPMAHFAVGDRMAAAYAMVTIVDHGWADQKEAARAFECSARTVRRAQRRFEKGGLAALGRGAGYPKGRARLRGARSRRVHDLKAQGQSNRAIAALLGVTEKAVRKLLRRLGWKPPEPEQRELPLGPAGSIERRQVPGQQRGQCGGVGAARSVRGTVAVTLRDLCGPSD